MGAKPPLAGNGGDALDLGKGPDGPAPSVVGVLDDEEPRPREMNGILPDCILHVRGLEQPAGARERTDHAPRECGGSARFIVDDVAPLVRDDLVAVLGVGADGRLVRHRPRGHKARGLLPEHRGHALLKGDDRRVVA